MLRLFPTAAASPPGAPADRSGRRPGLFIRIFLRPYGRMPSNEFLYAALIQLLLFAVLGVIGGVSLYAESSFRHPTDVLVGLFGFALMLLLFFLWPAAFHTLWLKRLRDAGDATGSVKGGLLLLASYLLLGSGVVLVWLTRFVPLILLPHAAVSLLLLIPPSRLPAVSGEDG